LIKSDRQSQGSLFSQTSPRSFAMFNCDPPRLVFGEQQGRRSPARLFYLCTYADYSKHD
jgi:hypothetical protein